MANKKLATVVICWMFATEFPGQTRAELDPSAESVIELAARRRDSRGDLVTQRLSLDPNKTAVVVIDMWDRHWCQTYTSRVANLVPRMNDTLDAVRELGVQVVFAPSDTTAFYREYPQRKAMLAIGQHPAPKTNDYNPPSPPGPTDHCECGPDQPCPKGGVWTRQHPALTIKDDDLIGDCNNGRELLNLCHERDIDTLLYMGVASNMCVLHRSMGIRNMKKHGLRAIVVADLVEAITANGIGPDGKADRNFTPAKGSARIQRYIEQHVAPTIESRALIAAAGGGDEASDRRPHIVFVVAEQEYDSGNTLPAFAKKHLANDYRCTFCFAKGNDGPGRNDVPGMSALYDADLLVLSMRRRALPVIQMDFLERYIRGGKPIVAIRVSVVPFQVRGEIPRGHVIWDRFDQAVLGCNYHGYDAGSRQAGCEVWTAPGAAEHPILADVHPPEFHSRSWIYKQRPLADNVTVLMEGRWAKDQPEEPVAWTNTYRGGRVFYTTLGHPEDFKTKPFNQLLLGGVRWSLKRNPTLRKVEN